MALLDILRRQFSQDFTKGHNEEDQKATKILAETPHHDWEINEMDSFGKKTSHYTIPKQQLCYEN